MSASQPVAPGDASVAVPAPDPRRNPSYPRRIHWGEREELLKTRQLWETRVGEAGKKLATLASNPKRDFYTYVHAQMLGGLDQVSDCVRRLPGETGDLYTEDKHRIEQAISALERLFVKWDKGA